MASAKHEAMDERMSITDDLEDLLSNTDVEESFMGNDKQWDSTDLEARKWMNKRSKFAAALGSCRWIIDAILLLVIIALLMVLWDQRRTKESASTTIQIGGDYTGASEGC